MSDDLIINNSILAIRYRQKSINLTEKIHFKKVMAKSYQNLGIAYFKISEYPKALDNCRKALKVSEEMGAKSEIAKAINNIGNIYYYMSFHYLMVWI